MARLTPGDWCEAALYAIGDGGVRSLSVERLAKGLGVTKGSFYWHFKNRDALLEAALAYWRDVGTVEIIERLATLEGPSDRLRGLLAEALRDPKQMRVEAALMSAASVGHPLVSPVYTAVNEARLAYVRALYVELDVDSPAAWATTTYAAYLGAVQLAAMQPETLKNPTELVAHLQARLIPEIEYTSS